MKSTQVSVFYGDEGKSATVFYNENKTYSVVFLGITIMRSNENTHLQLAEDAAEDWCISC
jgi:imidazole glycerol phosphate synthase subunit HisF